MDDLPSDLLLEIATWLPLADLMRYLCLNRRFRALGNRQRFQTALHVRLCHLYNPDACFRRLVASGNVTILKWLIKVHDDERFPWCTATATAACLGHDETLRWILDQVDCYWTGGLKAAAAGGHLQVVEYLVDRFGQHTNPMTGAMWAAAEAGRMEVVDWFLDHGASTSSTVNGAMRAAASSGHFNVVKRLAERGADQWNYGLEAAATAGHLELVQWFIERGADQWKWAMQVAASRGHLEVVRWLGQHSARDVDLAHF